MPEEITGAKLPDVKILKIDPWSIVKAIVILIVFFLLYLIRDIILTLIAAIILSAAVSPLVDFLEKKKIRRSVGATLVYLLIILILVGIILPIVPIVSQQMRYLFEHMPNYYQTIVQAFKIGQKTEANFWQKTVGDWLQNFKIPSGTIFNLVGSVLGWFFVIFIVFVVAFYLTIQKNVLRETLRSILPGKYKDGLAVAFDLAQKKVGDWVRGIFLLSLSVGLMAFIGLSILDVRYSLLLALVAGMTEVIPWIGPWLGGIIAVIITLTYSPIKALLVAILFLTVQQIENYLLVPQVMKKTVGLNPLLVIIIVLIGGKLAGPIGVFLAVPTVVIVGIFIREYLLCRKIRLHKN